MGNKKNVVAKYYTIVDEKTGRAVCSYGTSMPLCYLTESSSFVLRRVLQRGTTGRIVKIDANRYTRHYLPPTVFTLAAANELIANYGKFIQKSDLVKDGNPVRPALRIVKCLVYESSLSPDDIAKKRFRTLNKRHKHGLPVAKYHPAFINDLYHTVTL